MNEYVTKSAVFKAILDALAYEKSAFDTINGIPAEDVVPGSEFRRCRGELCLKCGAYAERHLGACDGCRWRQSNG